MVKVFVFMFEFSEGNSVNENFKHGELDSVTELENSSYICGMKNKRRDD